jgi:hypothetical protein
LLTLLLLLLLGAQNEPQYLRALMMRNRKHRFREMQAMCANKHVCKDDAGPGPADGAAGPADGPAGAAAAAAAKKPRGCGNLQPKIKVEGPLRLVAEVRRSPHETRGAARTDGRARSGRSRRARRSHGGWC